jgi:hypothetical protein
MANALQANRMKQQATQTSGNIRKVSANDPAAAEVVRNAAEPHVQLIQRLDRLSETFRNRCEARRLCLVGGFSLLYLSSALVLAWNKLLWNDELYTLSIARLTSVAEIWSALSTGADQIPPLFHLIVRASLLSVCRKSSGSGL